MEKMRMETESLVDENIKKLMELFPSIVTETVKDGKVARAVDFDALKQELSDVVVEGNEERYQFTWPDKRKARLLANTPVRATLRPCKEESVEFDTTQNLYIEGDNLDVIKLLRETYLGKIKMIYIDPPYNTGNDFVYSDDFSMSGEKYSQIGGDYDEQGNRLFQNTSSNGRFHTDWLNMMYPRLKLSKNLLAKNGVIFISMDDHEVENLRKICDEVFGESNFVAMFPWRKRTAKSDVPFGVSQDYEWIVCYAGGQEFRASVTGKERKYYETPDFPGRPWRTHDMTTQRTASERPNSFFTMVNPKTGDEYPCDPNRTWRVTKDTFQKYYDANEIIFPGDYSFLNISKPVARYFKDDDMDRDGENFGRVAMSTKLPEDIGMSQNGTKEIKELFSNIPFSFPKPIKLLKYLIETTTSPDDLILDFFSGSSTTAHAVMQLNAEDGGNRKFIMIQVPEICSEDTEAYKAGYKTICEIGKERIRRAGKKIKEETGLMLQNLDTGFRVLKLDSSNMKDVWYKPDEISQQSIEDTLSNVKEDRTPMDLLFQVMLENDALLSSKIDEKVIEGKKVFVVNDNDIVCCFDSDIGDNVVKAIAQMKPLYAVFRDSSFKSDDTRVNAEQYFKTYSPKTECRII